MNKDCRGSGRIQEPSTSEHRPFRGSATQQNAQTRVRKGSWLCEKSKALDSERRNVCPNRRHLHQHSQVGLILADLRKIILASFHFFTFLHSLGQDRPIRPDHCTSAVLPIALMGPSFGASHCANRKPTRRGKEAIETIHFCNVGAAAFAHRCARPAMSFRTQLV